MKVKFNQCIYLSSNNRLYNRGEEADVDKNIARELIKADVAEEIKSVDRKPIKKTKAVDEA